MRVPWMLVFGGGCRGANVPPMAPLRKGSARPAGGLSLVESHRRADAFAGIDSGIENACPIWAGPRRYIDTVRANCGQTSEQLSKGKQRGSLMAFEIVAEKESETVRMTRNSSLIAIAKARVWASEGWNVTIVAGDDELPKFVRKSAPPLVYS
jgi:hypothetical protein